MKPLPQLGVYFSIEETFNIIRNKAGLNYMHPKSDTDLYSKIYIKLFDFFMVKVDSVQELLQINIDERY